MTRKPQPLSVPKNYLILLAGLAWTAAGVMVTWAGLPLIAALGPAAPWLFALAPVVFAAFYFGIFGPLVGKHTHRVGSMPEGRRPFWQFFDAPSYVVMAVMMGGGMALRLLHLVPDWFIAFFYSGLGIALFACGVRFLARFGRRTVLQPIES